MPKLTDKFLATLTLENGRKDRLVFDTACPGLGCRVTARGTRTFIAQWTDPATRRKVREPIGVWGNLTIDQAREAVRVRLRPKISGERASRSSSTIDSFGIVRLPPSVSASPHGLHQPPCSTFVLRSKARHRGAKGSCQRPAPCTGSAQLHRRTIRFPVHSRQLA